MGILPKILTFFITLLIVTIFACIMFVFLIIGLNGFPSGKAAQPGITLYSIWAILTTLLSPILSVVTAWILVDKRSVQTPNAVLISVIVFSIIGGISLFIGWALGLAYASYAFSNR